jgi:hypothetical protein
VRVRYLRRTFPFLHGARGARYHALRRTFTRSLDASYRAIGATSDLQPAELR